MVQGEQRPLDRRAVRQLGEVGDRFRFALSLGDEAHGDHLAAIVDRVPERTAFNLVAESIYATEGGMV